MKAKPTPDKMGSEPEALEPNLEQLLDDSLVADYLENHPGFFNRHPHLIAKLNIDSHQRGTISLVERQMELLRQQIRFLEEEITALLSVASQNEVLYRQYAELFLALCASDSIKQLHQLLEQKITGDMGLSQVVLKLYAADAPDSLKIQGYELEAVLVNRLRGQRHYFGRLSQDEQLQLFNQADEGSVALIALGDNQDQGLLAIASSNPTHFHPDMDPLLLNQLCRLLSLLINKHLLNARPNNARPNNTSSNKK